ncbi:hypothetical protein BDF21DRAFT_164309 [Thamnidium elegans]|nr:hypothetical protein BDF21DRAFT_164309 [Thamnidium elegans]
MPFSPHVLYIKYFKSVYITRTTFNHIFFLSKQYYFCAHTNSVYSTFFFCVNCTGGVGFFLINEREPKREDVDRIVGSWHYSKINKRRSSQFNNNSHTIMHFLWISYLLFSHNIYIFFTCIFFSLPLT